MIYYDDDQSLQIARWLSKAFQTAMTYDMRWFIDVHRAPSSSSSSCSSVADSMSVKRAVSAVSAVSLVTSCKMPKLELQQFERLGFRGLGCGAGEIMWILPQRLIWLNNLSNLELEQPHTTTYNHIWMSQTAGAYWNVLLPAPEHSFHGVLFGWPFNGRLLQRHRILLRADLALPSTYFQYLSINSTCFSFTIFTPWFLSILIRFLFHSICALEAPGLAGLGSTIVFERLPLRAVAKRQCFREK